MLLFAVSSPDGQNIEQLTFLSASVSFTPELDSLHSNQSFWLPVQHGCCVGSPLQGNLTPDILTCCLTTAHFKLENL